MIRRVIVMKKTPVFALTCSSLPEQSKPPNLGDGYLIYWFLDPSQTNFTRSGGR